MLVSCAFGAILMSCFLPGQADEPDNVLDFLATVTGRWSNQDQYLRDNQTFDLIQFEFIPTTIPALGDAPLLIVEQWVNGARNNFFIGTVTQDDSGIIFLTPIVVPPPTEESLDDFYEYVNSLNAEDLVYLLQCRAVGTRESATVYTGPLPLCINLIGPEPAYQVKLTCDEIFLTVPVEAKEKSAPVPYELVKLASYLIPNLPVDYTAPCDAID